MSLHVETLQRVKTEKKKNREKQRTLINSKTHGP